MSHVHGQFYGGDLFPIPMVPHRESHQPTIQQTMSTKSTHEILFYEKIRIPIVSKKNHHEKVVKYLKKKIRSKIPFCTCFALTTIFNIFHTAVSNKSE